MIAQKHSNHESRHTDSIRVLPATHERSVELQQLAMLAYEVSPQVAARYWSTKMFRARNEAFPEGQWMAVDTTTGKVIGYTSGMRFDFDRNAPLLETWERTTGYG